MPSTDGSSRIRHCAPSNLACVKIMRQTCSPMSNIIWSICWIPLPLMNPAGPSVIQRCSFYWIMTRNIIRNWLIRYICIWSCLMRWTGRMLQINNFIVLLKTDLFKQISFQAASKNTCRRQLGKFLPLPVCRYFYYVYIFIMFIFLSRIIFYICISNPHIKTLHTFSRFSRIAICCGQASSHSIPPVILVITRRQIRSQWICHRTDRHCL